ncbi:hypothetical protein WR25_10515 [Diploscapter pachys]|uniref:DH domain-containing protein n=1 Tax=Diploscapter pachys TaxID=2018661 RepID=A0A2A2JYL8_9BILA|nr:hypothetical protein WR25_10515 [Diploscapter pachys]
MGARLTCACPQSHLFNDEHTLSISGELFELDSTGNKWLKLYPSLVNFIIEQTVDEAPLLTVKTDDGHVLLETHFDDERRLDRISDCFVYWREPEVNGVQRTLGMNTVSARDAALLMKHAQPGMTMMQHTATARIRLLATWNGKRIEEKPTVQETSLVALNPLSLVFHYNNSIINIDLLECFACTCHDRQNIIQLSYGANIYELQLNKNAEDFIRQMLNMSSLLLARSTCIEVAVSYLQRQRHKVKEKIAQLKFEGNRDGVSREKLLLKELSILQRLAGLTSQTLPSYESIGAELSDALTARLLPYSLLPSLFLIFANMHAFRIWRKPIELRASDLQILSESHSAPNGMMHHVDGMTASTSNYIDSEIEEYNVAKKDGRLGLTIYAHNDNGVVKAEVRQVATFAPKCASIGDTVVSVDGRSISTLPSAADVEQLLRDGKVIRLRRGAKDTIKKQAPPPPIRQNSAPVPIERSRADEKLLRALEELVQTEKRYVEDLIEMIGRFLSIPSVKEIMECAFRLQDTQKEFMSELLEAVGDVGRETNCRSQMRDAVNRVSALFVNRCSQFKVYAEYAASYLRLQQEIVTKKEIHVQLEAANTTREQHCSYESMMIKPIQRVVQYPLLLNAIHSACEKESFEAKQVSGSLAKMQTLAEYVNEMQRIHELFAPHIDNVKKSFETMLREKGLRIDIRDLLIFAHIKWLDAEKTMQDYVVFVFHSVLLLLPAVVRRECKMKWVRVLPINELEVEENKVQSDAISLVHVAFQSPGGQLSHGNQEGVYRISCCQSQLKNQLMKSIRKARANFVKNTRRPQSGSSLSDGGYGSDFSKERKDV